MSKCQAQSQGEAIAVVEEQGGVDNVLLIKAGLVASEITCVDDVMLTESDFLEIRG